MESEGIIVQQSKSVDKRKKNSARLIWDSKPKRAPNPKDIEFQTAEIVIPNPARDQTKLAYVIPDLSKAKLDPSNRNRLIWGDNLLAMQALLASGYEGRIDLIYIDPPFWTGENYYLNVVIGNETVTKSPSVIERLAYKDYWEGGADSYLDMLYPRLQLMKRLLADNGSIYVHLDWHMVHYVNVVMDEIFGKDGLVNEIIWHYKTFQGQTHRYFAKKHDTLLLYSKSDSYKYRAQFDTEFEDTIDSRKSVCFQDGANDKCWDKIRGKGEERSRAYLSTVEKRRAPKFLEERGSTYSECRGSSNRTLEVGSGAACPRATTCNLRT